MDEGLSHDPGGGVRVVRSFDRGGTIRHAEQSVMELETNHGLLEPWTQCIFLDRNGKNLATALAQSLLHECAGQPLYGP